MATTTTMTTTMMVLQVRRMGEGGSAGDASAWGEGVAKLKASLERARADAAREDGPSQAWHPQPMHPTPAALSAIAGRARAVGSRLPPAPARPGLPPAAALLQPCRDVLAVVITGASRYRVPRTFREGGGSQHSASTPPHPTPTALRLQPATHHPQVRAPPPIKLLPAAVVSVGRSRSSACVLKHLSVSNHHATLRRSNTGQVRPGAGEGLLAAVGT